MMLLCFICVAIGYYFLRSVQYIQVYENLLLGALVPLWYKTKDSKRMSTAIFSAIVGNLALGLIFSDAIRSALYILR
jgi:hypothetical protein